MNKYIKYLKEIPLLENFVSSQKNEVFRKLNEKNSFNIRYLIPAFGIAIVILLFIFKDNKTNLNQIDDNLYFYSYIDMLEYMDVLENVSEEELR